MTPKIRADFQKWTRSVRVKRADGWNWPTVDWGNNAQNSAPAPLPYGPSEYSSYMPPGQDYTNTKYHLPMALQTMAEPLMFAKDFALGNSQMGTPGVISNMWNNVVGPGQSYSPFRGQGTVSSPYLNAMQAREQRTYNNPWVSDRADAINRARTSPATASVGDRFTGWAANLAGRLGGVNNNDALDKMNADEAAKITPSYGVKTY